MKRTSTIFSWFTTPNPLLGDVSPIDMIRAGRGDKLCRWVDSQIKESYSPHMIKHGSDTVCDDCKDA